MKVAKALGSIGTAGTFALIATLAVAQDGPSGQVIWWGWKPNQDDATRILEVLDSQYPEVEVEFTYQVYGDYVPALKLNIAAGEAPDVWFTESGALLEEHAPFVEDLRPWAERTWGPNWEEMWVGEPLRASMDGDVVLGLPWLNLGAGLLWYNKTHFDRLGLTPPTTLAEWQEVNEALREAGLIPFVQGASESWINFDHFMAIANQIAPGKIYEADAGTIEWTDPELVAAMEVWKSLFDLGIMQEGAVAAKQYPDAHDLFSSGQAAMVMMGTWHNSAMTPEVLAEYQSTFGFTEEFEFVPFAYPDIDGDGNTGPMTVGPDAIVVMNRDSENKEAAWALIEVLMTEQVQTMIHADRLNTPAIASVQLDPAAAMTDPQREGLVLQTSLMAESTYPRKLSGTETSTALGIALQEVASGQLSPADALAEVQRVAERDQG